MLACIAGIPKASAVCVAAAAAALLGDSGLVVSSRRHGGALALGQAQSVRK